MLEGLPAFRRGLILATAAGFEWFCEPDIVHSLCLRQMTRQPYLKKRKSYVPEASLFFFNS